MTLLPRSNLDQAGRRRGVILLFVVVLLTLLAVLGSAYLVSSKLDAGQAGVAARGGSVDDFGLDARDRVDDIVSRAAEAAQRQLFLDLFASVREQGRGGDNPSLNWETTDLIWRASPSTAVTAFTPPAGDPVPHLFNRLQPFDDTGLYLGTFTDIAGTRQSTGNNPPPLVFPYLHLDAEGGSDPHIASRLPVYDASTGITTFVWPWVSAPPVGLAGFQVDNVFYDPLYPMLAPGGGRGSVFLEDVAAPAPPASGPTALENIRARLVPDVTEAVVYAPSAEVLAADGNLTGGDTDATFYNDRARVYPLLAKVNPSTGTVIRSFTAGDADGDGVADSGLAPIVFNTGFDIGTRARYLDTQTGLVYLVGMRVVDNNAAVNVNTAFSSYGDVQLAPTPIEFGSAAAVTAPAAEVTTKFAYEPALTGGTVPGITMLPNRGIYRSNIGFYELLYNGSPATGTGQTRGDQFAEFMGTALGGRVTARVNDGSTLFTNDPDKTVAAGDGPRQPVTGASNNPRLAGGIGDVRFGTLGEAMEMNRARLLGGEGLPLPSADAGGGFLSLDGVYPAQPFRGEEEAQSLLFRGGGFLRPGQPATPLERSLYDSLVVSAGNFVPVPDYAFDTFPIGNFGSGVGGNPGVGAPVTAENTDALRSVWATLFKSADPQYTDFFASLIDRSEPNVDEFRNKSAGSIGPTGSFPVSPRAGLVTRNGVSMAISPPVLQVGPTYVASGLNAPGLVPAGMPPYYSSPGAATEVLPRPPVKANVNTAKFNELWRGYYNAMVASAPGVITPRPTAPTPDLLFDAPIAAAGTDVDAFAVDDLNAHADLPLGTQPALTREQVLLLRAAIAAVNTMDIRDVDRVYPTYALGGGPGTVAPPDPTGYPTTPTPHPLAPDYTATPNPKLYPSGGGAGQPMPGDNDVTVAEIALGPPATPGGPGTAPFVRVYGTEAQPFIDEIVFDVGGGSVAYMAIELMNPYPFPIRVEGWQIAALNRSTPGTTAVETVATLTSGVGNPPLLIPAADPSAGRPGFLFVETPPTATPPTYRANRTPSAVKTDNVIEAGPGLEMDPSVTLDPAELIDTGTPANLREIVLMRPPRNDVPLATYGLNDLVPLDSVDLRGIDPSLATTTTYRYARSSGVNTAGDVIREWDYVYSGEYSATAVPRSDDVDSAPLPVLPETTIGTTFGATNPAKTVPPTLPVRGEATVDGDIDVPVGPVLSGPTRQPNEAKASFPYGGFARDGDIFNVPLRWRLPHPGHWWDHPRLRVAADGPGLRRRRRCRHGRRQRGPVLGPRRRRQGRRGLGDGPSRLPDCRALARL